MRGFGENKEGGGSIPRYGVRTHSGEIMVEMLIQCVGICYVY